MNQSGNNVNSNQKIYKMIRYNKAKLIPFGDYQEKDWRVGNVIKFEDGTLIMIGDDRKIMENIKPGEKCIDLPYSITKQFYNPCEYYEDLINQGVINSITFDYHNSFLYKIYDNPPNGLYTYFPNSNKLKLTIGEFVFNFGEIPTREEMKMVDPYQINLYYNWLIQLKQDNKLGESELFDILDINTDYYCLATLKTNLISTPGKPSQYYYKLVNLYNKYEIEKQIFIRREYSDFEKMQMCGKDCFSKKENRIDGMTSYAIYQKDGKTFCSLTVKYTSKAKVEDVENIFKEYGCKVPDAISFTYLDLCSC